MMLILPVMAHAQMQAPDRLSSPQDDRFRLSAGLLSATAETEMRLDADDGTPGTALTGEEDLGLRERSEVGDVEMEVRIRERHRVRFNFFQLDRRATQALARDIQFGNDLYAVDDVVDSRIDLRTFGMSYAYELLRQERFELGLSLGLNIAQVDAEAEVDARRISERETRNGPVPAVGVHALFRISKRFHVEARGEYMQLTVSDIEGTVMNLRGALLYRFNRNLGLGLGYTSNEIEIISTDIGDTGQFKLKTSGGELFLRVAF
jgi:hypothetical protein